MADDQRLDMTPSPEFNAGKFQPETHKLLKKLKKVGLEFAWEPSKLLPGVGIDFEIVGSPEKGWSNDERAFRSQLHYYLENQDTYLAFKQTGKWEAPVVKTQRYDIKGKPVGREK